MLADTWKISMPAYAILSRHLLWPVLGQISIRACSYAVFAPIIYTLRFSQKDSSSSPCCTTEWMRCAIWGRR